MPLIRRFLLVVCTTSALVFSLTPIASAHAELVSSNPAEASTLRKLPSQVTITFNENVATEGAALVVTNPDSQRIDNRDASVQGAQLTATLDRASRVAGTYTVAYRVVSDDGHPVAGQFSFAVAGGQETAAPVSSGAGDPNTAPALSSSGRGSVAVLAMVTVLVGVGWGLTQWARRRRRG